MASKTKENIIKNYLHLLESNEYDKVTVTDLVEICNISRQTFYYHFDSIEAMIKWSFDNEIEKALKNAKNCKTWMSALRTLVPMLEKHDAILRSAQKSTNLIFIQDILGCSIYHFTVDFYLNILHYEGDINYFLVKYSSAAIIGLIFMEMNHTENFSYERLFNEIEITFSQTK